MIFKDELTNSKAFSQLKKDIKSGLGHAYMIVSFDDALTDSFFTLAAMRIYCERGTGCGECAECKKVLHSTHSDIFHINEKGEKIKVEDISKGLIDTVNVKHLVNRKLYFIHRADLMLPAAQNKLLKTLEDPPEDVTIFLGVANESSMLATVASRVRKIYMDSFDEDAIFNFLVGQNIPEEAASVAAACSDGMPGRALTLAKDEEYVALYRSALEVFKKLQKSSDVLAVENFMQKTSNVSKLVDLMAIVARDMLVSKNDKELMLSKHIGGEIVSLADGYSELALAKIAGLINNFRKKQSVNVNGVACLDSLLFSILEVRHKWQR